MRAHQPRGTQACGLPSAHVTLTVWEERLTLHTSHCRRDDFRQSPWRGTSSLCRREGRGLLYKL